MAGISTIENEYYWRRSSADLVNIDSKLVSFEIKGKKT